MCGREKKCFTELNRECYVISSNSTSDWWLAFAGIVSSMVVFYDMPQPYLFVSSGRGLNPPKRFEYQWAAIASSETSFLQTLSFLYVHWPLLGSRILDLGRRRLIGVKNWNRFGRYLADVGTYRFLRYCLSFNSSLIPTNTCPGLYIPDTKKACETVW